MDRTKASLWQIFTVFAGIGTFTIGGGYAMIPLIERAMLRRRWISEDEMPDIVVLAQSAPGLLAVNMAIYSGYRLRGLPGAVAATIGAVLPSFVIILLVAMLFTEIKDNPVVERIFRGVRPVAVGLIVIPAVNMARKGCRRWWQWMLALCTLAAIVLLKFSPIYIILITIVTAVGITLFKESRGGNRQAPGSRTGSPAPQEGEKQAPGSKTGSPAPREGEKQVPGSKTDTPAPREEEKQAPGSKTGAPAPREGKKQVPGSKAKEAPGKK